MGINPDQNCEALYRAAIAAMDHAYTPYSNHPVASAIRADNGNVYTGVNVEVAHYKGLCAEASAIAAMITDGQYKIADIAVIGPGESLCTPCGDCRQRIREFADEDTTIHVMDKSGVILKSYTMDELLPDSFGPENLLN
jgi:cytidine deaminase